jgi:hypothetical protein
VAAGKGDSNVLVSLASEPVGAHGAAGGQKIELALTAIQTRF